MHCTILLTRWALPTLLDLLQRMCRGGKCDCHRTAARLLSDCLNASPRLHHLDFSHAHAILPRKEQVAMASCL